MGDATKGPARTGRPEDEDIGFTHHGATLVFPDLPPQSAIGIDQTIHTVSESFKGVKHVPPGVHVLSYAAYDRTGDRYGPVMAFFVDIPAIPRTVNDRYAQEGMASSSDVEAWMMDGAFHGPVLGWTWQAGEEVLVAMDEEMLLRAENMVREMRWDRQLGSYYAMTMMEASLHEHGSGSSFGQWRALSAHVDARVVKRLAPKEGGISATMEEDHGVLLHGKRSRAELALDAQLGRGGASSGEGEAVDGKLGAGLRSQGACSHAGRCRFTAVPNPLIKDASLSAEERTAWNMDKSQALERMLKEQYRGNSAMFLGELQFAFLAFILGHSLEGFLQWKKLVALLLGCDEAVRAHPDLFEASLEVVYQQIAFSFRQDRGMELSGEVVGEHLFDDHFLKSLASGFIKSHAHDDGLDTRIREVVRRLGELLSKELCWECCSAKGLEDLEDDEDEDGPVVVHLS